MPVTHCEVSLFLSEPRTFGLRTGTVTMAKLSRKSDVAMAIHYALERWVALLLFSDDGRAEMDNNAAARIRFESFRSVFG